MNEPNRKTPVSLPIIGKSEEEKIMILCCLPFESKPVFFFVKFPLFCLYTKLNFVVRTTQLSAEEIVKPTSAFPG